MRGRHLIPLTGRRRSVSTFSLWPHQEQALAAISAAFFEHGQNRLLLQSATGCHRRGQLLLMYDGSLKAVEHVEVGDLLMGPYSQPRTVLSLARGVQEMAEVRPKKGASFVVNLDHVLTLQRTRVRTRGCGPRGKDRRRSDCLDHTLVDVSVRDWLQWRQTAKHRHKLRRYAVEWPRVEVPLPPYILGLLLGDGHLSEALA